MKLRRIITFAVLICALAVCGRTARAEDDENVIAAETYVIRFELNSDGRWEHIIPEEERVLWDYYLSPFYSEYEAFNVTEKDDRIILDNYSKTRGANPEPVWMYMDGACVYGDNAVYDAFRTYFGDDVVFYSIQSDYEVNSSFGCDPLRGAFEGQELNIYIDDGRGDEIRLYSPDLRMDLFYETSGISYHFLMPARDITITATDLKYPITVINGGAGYQFYEPIFEASPGEWVIIYPMAGPRDDGYYYTGKWNSDDVTLNDYKEGAVSIIMPDHAVTVSAELAKQEPVTVDLRTGSLQTDFDVCACLLQASGDERNAPFIDLNGDRIDDIIIDWNTYTIKTLEKYSCGASIELTGRTDWIYYPVTVLYDPELAKASAEATPTPTEAPTATVAPTAEPTLAPDAADPGSTDAANPANKSAESNSEKEKEKKARNEFNFFYIILPGVAVVFVTIAAWAVVKKKAKKNGKE